MTPSFTQESDFRREREFGQKISAAFDFIRTHWRPLGRVLLYTVVPAALAYGVLSSVLQLTLLNNSLQRLNDASRVGAQFNWNVTGAMMSSPAYWVSTLLGAAFFSLFILSIYGYVLCCLRGPGGTATATPITVADVWPIIRREFLSTVFSTLGLYLIIILSMFLFIIPGIYMAVTLSLFYIVKLVEGTSFSDTVGRCWNLIKGKWWSTFGLIMVMLLLVYALLFLVGLVTSVFSGSLVALMPRMAGQLPAVFTVVVTVLTMALMLFVYPPLLLALAFQYFNLVERREGLGLRSLVSQLGQSAPAAPRNASLRADEEGEY